MALFHDENHCESYYGRGSCYDALEQYTTKVKFNKHMQVYNEILNN